MAGIEAAEEMTSDQLDAMAGGDLLKNEVSSRHRFRKVSTLIKDSLHFVFCSLLFRPVTLAKCEILKNRLSA